MTAPPSYQFFGAIGVYQGVIPSQPGRIDTGGPDLYGRVLNNGTAVFRAPKDIGPSTGTLNVATNVSLDNFYSLTVNDILENSTIDVATHGAVSLHVNGASTDSVFVSVGANEGNSSTLESNFSTLTGLNVGGYGILGGTNTAEFDNVATVLVHGIGQRGFLGTANVIEDTQPKLTVVANLIEANLSLVGSPMSSLNLVQASNVGLLNLYGLDSSGIKVIADNLGVVNVNSQQAFDFIERRPSSNLNLNVTQAISGVFSLLGGNETVNVTQGAGSFANMAGQSVFTFDLKHSISSGTGDAITFTQIPNGDIYPSGEYNASFILGAGTADITVLGVAASLGANRIAFTGGAGVATIHGGAGGSDVTFGTGKMDVTGGTGQNSYVFDAYKAVSTSDTIEDFKVGTDILNLSSTVESETTINYAKGNTYINFGAHSITVPGAHLTAANINWTH